MNDKATAIGRRIALRNGAVAAATLVPVLATATRSRAATSHSLLSQASVHYVARATNGHECEDCKFYIPAVRTGPHRCRVVAGMIEPHGSCDLWTPLPAGTPDNG